MTVGERMFTVIDNAQWIEIVEEMHLCDRCGEEMQIDRAGPFTYWFCPECGFESELE